VTPPFDELHFVEVDPKRAEVLRRHVGDDPRATVHSADCNHVLPDLVQTRVQYSRFERAFCLLDPYGLQLDWNVVKIVARTRATDVLINLPIMGIHRNVVRTLGHNPNPARRARMTAFWGDESWVESLRLPAGQLPLFDEEATVKASHDYIAAAYCARLRDVAGFEYVGEPVAMRSDQNAVLYYLVFASQKEVAVKVMRDVARKSLRER
jgi:three-Cys-motif partner protein